MAISGKETILIGLQNESIGSDSLFTAFHKTANNFSTLFDTASPYNTFTGNGVSVAANSTAGSLDFTNTGVTQLVAGTGVYLAGTGAGSNVTHANGIVTISVTGGGGSGGGTVTSVGSYSDTLNYGTIAGGNTIVSAGTLTFNLKTTGVTAGTYTYPTVGVDQFGRVTSISNATSVGTVTSVGITPGAGIQVTNSPITTAGEITIVNTGVTRLNAGSGISVSGANGNVTISAVGGGTGTVTSVAITSTSLSVSGGPITSAGAIDIELPTNTTVTGNVVAGNVVTSGTISATGNANLGNIGTAGVVTATGNVRGGNINTAGIVSATGNIIGASKLLIGLSSTTLTSPVAVFSSAGATYVQSAVLNTTSTGSSDLVTYGNNGDDTQSWTDIGFTGNTFNDANYTVTAAGDGYLFVQGNSSFGGNLVIATGNTGTTKDIIFATGGFLTGNIKARLYNANGAFSVAGGILSNNATSGVGYATGSGGTVTQGTSRTTGVTLNKVSGAITLYTTAGSATYNTFTVTNSTVAATDVVVVSQKSGTDKYITMVSNVAAGSFSITFATTGGTTSEAPVFNFAVIKAVAA